MPAGGCGRCARGRGAITPLRFATETENGRHALCEKRGCSRTGTVRCARARRLDADAGSRCASLSATAKHREQPLRERGGRARSVVSADASVLEGTTSSRLVRNQQAMRRLASTRAPLPRAPVCVLAQRRDAFSQERADPLQTGIEKHRRVRGVRGGRPGGGAAGSRVVEVVLVGAEAVSYARPEASKGREQGFLRKEVRRSVSEAVGEVKAKAPGHERRGGTAFACCTAAVSEPESTRERARVSCSVCSATSSPIPASIAASTAAPPFSDRRTICADGPSYRACT